MFNFSLVISFLENKKLITFRYFIFNKNGVYLQIDKLIDTNLIKDKRNKASPD